MVEMALATEPNILLKDQTIILRACFGTSLHNREQELLKQYNDLLYKSVIDLLMHSDFQPYIVQARVNRRTTI